MPAKRPTRPNLSERQFAADVIRGVAEIEAMLGDGARPSDRFVVRVGQPIGVKPPHVYSAAGIREVRDRLDVSQAVFAELIGVPVGRVQGWESGRRRPSPPVRRLLDTIAADPAEWLARVAVSA